MKIVVVSQRIDFYPNRDEKRDALDQRLIKFLIMAGYLPITVPNSLGNKIKEWIANIPISAIVLSGGNNIGECPDRDETELNMLNYAFNHRLPLLGICRGMQMIAHWSGTKLHSVKGHANTSHRITGEINEEVNSYHLFSLLNCPKNFEILAKSEDGEIEAIRHKSLKWEGWMWHPERMDKFTTTDIDRIRVLFDG